MSKITFERNKAILKIEDCEEGLVLRIEEHIERNHVIAKIEPGEETKVFINTQIWLDPSALSRLYLFLGDFMQSQVSDESL